MDNLGCIVSSKPSWDNFLRLFCFLFQNKQMENQTKPKKGLLTVMEKLESFCYSFTLRQSLIPLTAHRSHKMEGHVLHIGTENRDSKSGSRIFDGLWEFVGLFTPRLFSL